MLFDNEKLRKLSNEQNLFERDYVRLLATSPELKWLREDLEKAFKKIPEKIRNKIFCDFWASDEKCFSVITELSIFDKLFNKFGNVKIEPSLSFANNKTPDFLINNQVCIEVLTVFHKIHPFEYSIRESINSLESNVSVLLFEIKYDWKSQPKLSEIKNKFKELFSLNRRISFPVDFEFITKQGIGISGSLIPKKGYKSNIQGLMDSSIGEIENSIISVRNRIKSKLNKYKAVSKRELPLVLMIKNRNDLLFDKEWVKIIYGEEINGKTKNGILNPNKNTSLTCILVTEYDSQFDQYMNFENPFAKNPLGSFQKDFNDIFRIRGINHNLN